jgi:hypothetical protein
VALSMRRLFLVLALTALLVASAFASGSALAQGEQSCEGLRNALASQERPALLPEALLHNPTKEVITTGTPPDTLSGVANPSQGEVHSADPVEQQVQGRCLPGPPT